MGSINSDSSLQTPLPSTTPPQRSWWVQGNGQGHTQLGHLWRLAVSAKRWGEDQLRGPIPDVPIPELAHRLDRMTSEQLLRLLLLFQSQKKNFHFSPYLCLNSIQSLDENALRDHLKEFLEYSAPAEDSIFVFPMYIKSSGTFESEHMTVFLAYRNTIEFYDSKGISSVNYKWTEQHSLCHVATIIHNVLYPTLPPSQPLENHNPHQSCIAMCGLFVAAWIHHRAIEGKSQREWLAKLENTSDEQVRLEVTKLLNMRPKEDQATGQIETEECIFEFDDE